ncbi:Ig-like domain repeat protein [Flavimobilis soli]|uniref:Ig-like domain repeat protein n=1 Tax=Flavimobilis soli TaxID=442709 RepID=UPI000BF83CC4|nr:Ig-like domain repeat protein [Flavimobilis soli]
MAAVAPSAHAAGLATAIDDAQLDWGVSGYAQQGVFGAWTFGAFQGDASYLDGTAGQTEYAVDAYPASSLPVGITPNAVRFSGGTGSLDRTTGDVTVSWTGSYTVNAYPSTFGAPSETYADPQLVIADGAARLTFDVTFGEGKDTGGATVPAVDAGRIAVATVADVDVADVLDGDFRLQPDYQGVTLPSSVVTNQSTSCVASGGATGWWGSWPEEFVAVVPTSLKSHFYSTSCGGSQDKKPALPLAVDLGIKGAVTVSQTTVAADGTTTVTVEGRNFDPSFAIGTRPPFAGLQSGVYIAFARAEDAWRPSEGGTSPKLAASELRNGVSVMWAIPAASFAASSPTQSIDGTGYTELRTDGSFTTTVKVDKSWLADVPGRYGIYTYAGGGPKVAAYETFTPLTFVEAPKITRQPAAVSVVDGSKATFTVAATGGGKLAYQWQRKNASGSWADVAGATSSSYALTAALAAHGTEYRAVVSNEVGSVTSAAARLTVTAKPVVDAKATSSLSVPASVRYAGTASVSVKRVAGKPAPTGKVTITSGSTTVGSATLKNGVAKVKLSTKLGVGAKRSLTFTYSGDSAYKPVTVTRTVKVAKASAKVKATLAKKKVSTKARSKVSVKVTATGTTPGGKVTVTATKGKKKVVRTVSLTKGKGAVTLPRLAKGTWTVKATYSGSSKVTKATSGKTRLVVG